jgi:hypothetical protein
MKNWRIGIFMLACAGVLIGAGASGRAATWANPEGDGQVQAPESNEVAVSNRQPTADAESANGAESAVSQRNR